MTTAPYSIDVKTTEDPLEALRREHPLALQRFYTDHVADVSRLVRRVLGPDHEHEDVVQEVFFHAFKQLPGYRGDIHGLGPWLRKIATHRCLKLIRYRRVRWWLTWRRDEDLPEPETPDRAHHAALLKRAYTVLEHLSAEEQLVFTLRYLEGLSVPEIVETSGLSRSTTKRRLENARTKFLARARRDPLLASWAEEAP